MRAAPRLLVAVLLAAVSPGPQAWAQVAASQAAGAGAPVAPIALPARVAVSPAGLAPALPTAAQLSAGLGQFQAPVVSPAAIQSPAAARAAATAPIAPAPTRVGAAEQGPVATAKQLAETSRAAAPLVERASSARHGASADHATGFAIEELLTGRRNLRSFVDAGAAALETEEASPAKSRDGLKPSDASASSENAGDVPAPLPPEANRGFRLYATGVAAVKVGIETLNLAVPLLLMVQLGNPAVLGALFVTAQIAGMFSAGLAGSLIDKIGPAKTLAAATFIEMLTIGVVPLSLVFGVSVSLPIIFGLFVIDGAMAGIVEVSRRAAVPGILGNNQETLTKYNGRLYTAREIGAIASVFGAGWLINHIGALATLAVHPAAYLTAVISFFLLARRFKAAQGGPEQIDPAEQPAVRSWSQFLLGARLVLKDPKMRIAALANIPVASVHNLFHAMLAVVFATSILGNPGAAAILLGCWNAGELAAALFMGKEGKGRTVPATLMWAGLAGLASWAFAGSSSLWLAAGASFLMGAGTLSNEISLASLFQSHAPKEHVGAVAGFAYSVATASAMLFVLGVGAALKFLGPQSGMVLLAAIISAISVGYFFASRSLAKK